MRKQYFSMEKEGAEANINIYGDISSWGDKDTAPTAKSLAAVLDSLNDVTKLNVYINSYGGEVAEGLAIYNALKRHKAKIKTVCDGFAASIASVIFMAGDERVMNDSSLLMIHNAWSVGMGNAEQLRKQADDLDKINEASVAAYLAHSSLSEEEIKTLMNQETWILPEEALEYGFATAIEKTASKGASQSAKKSLLEMVRAYRQEAEEEDEEETEKETEGEPTEEEAEEEKPDDESEETETTSTEDEEDEEDEKPEEEQAEQGFQMFIKAILKM